MGGIIFDIVVATAVGVNGDLHVGEADSATDHLVECAVAATGVEAHGVVGMVGAPLAGPKDSVALGLGDVDLIIKIGVVGGVGFDFLGH